MPKDLNKEKVIQAWKTLSSKALIDESFFKLIKQECTLPDGKIMPSYFTFEFNSWANIFAITKGKEVVLVEQYRHSAKKNFFEIPGGAVELGEDPKNAAIRELKEETGFLAENIELVCKQYPNPALQNNSMYTYLALDCEKLFEQKLDPFEDIKVHLVALDRLEDWIEANDQFNHSIVLASIYKSLRLLKNKGLI